MPIFEVLVRKISAAVDVNYERTYYFWDSMYSGNQYAKIHNQQYKSKIREYFLLHNKNLILSCFSFFFCSNPSMA